QAIEAQHRSEQRRHPDDPGHDPPEELRLRPDAERKQQHGEHKKPDDEPDVAALPQREPNVTAKEPRKRRHHEEAASATSHKAAKSSGLMAPAPVSANGWFVAIATRPPAARCSAIRASK